MLSGSVISIISKPNENVNETEVPLLLCITLYVSRTLGGAPARLWRARSVWWLGVSPSLATLQRLIVVVTNILTLSALILDFQLPKEHRVRVGQTALVGCIATVEACIILATYTIGVLSAKKFLKPVISSLQQLHKIKTNLRVVNDSTEIKKDKYKYYYLLILYITWLAATYFLAILDLIYRGTKNEDISRWVCWLWIVAFYQTLVTIILQLRVQWSVTLVEINSVLTLLNDKLNFLYENPELRHLGFKSTRSLSQNYNVISDLLKQQMNSNGPFLLMYFILLFMHLLITPYNVIVGFDADSQFIIVRQINWSLQHLVKLLALVEPCHRLQIQKGRTRRLLSGLAREMNRQQVVPAQLKLFLIQAQMIDFTLAPCYVFNISRQLLASVIGSVITYLIFIVQIQSTREFI